MANIKSAIKRVRTAEKSRILNRNVKAKMKTTIKNYLAAIESGDSEKAKASYLDVQKSLDKAVTKGIIHKNNAARRKARLAKKLISA